MKALSDEDRQKRTGWLLIVVSGLYLVWFLKTRLLTEGLPITNREVTAFMGMSICLVLGTVNVRMAARREERRKAEQSNRESV